MTLSRLKALRSLVEKTSVQTLLSYFSFIFLVGAELPLPFKQNIAPSWILSCLVFSGLFGFAALLIDCHSLITSTWKNPVTKVVVAFATFWISVYSLSLADDYIVEYTSLVPSKFSRAQTLLASAIAPILWAIVLAFVCIGLYILQFLFMLRAELLSYRWFLRLKPYRLLRIIFSLPKEPRKAPNIVLEAAKLIGPGITTIVIMCLLRLTTTEGFVDRPLRTLFVMTSFYKNNGACPKLPKENDISLLDDGRVLHVADQDALTIRIANCR